MDCFPTLQAFPPTRWGKIVLSSKCIPKPTAFYLCSMKQLDKRGVAAKNCRYSLYFPPLQHNALCAKRADACLLQVASAFLLALNRFEQGLKVALAKRFSAPALDDLEKQRWTVFHWLCKQLQHIAFIVPIDKNAVFL